MSGRLAQDVDDREAVFLRDRHVDARHQREMIGHVAFVAVAEIVLNVFRPLVGFGEQHLALGVGVELGAQVLDHRMRLGKVFVRRALALAEIGDGVEPEAVDAGIEPALHHLDHGADDARIVEVEIRLVREEAMPVVGLRFRIPGPVRFLGVGEDDAGLRVALVGVAPDIPVARARAGRAAARAPEPGMLVRGVIDDEFGDDAQPAPLRFGDEAAEVLHRAEVGIDRAVVGDVVTVVAAGRRIERQQPDGGDAELLQIIELLGQAREVADAVIVAVGERLDVQLVDDRVLVPELVGGDELSGIDRGELVHGSALTTRQRKSSAGSRIGIDAQMYAAPFDRRGAHW